MIGHTLLMCTFFVYIYLTFSYLVGLLDLDILSILNA